jgi:hypothetical protein
MRWLFRLGSQRRALPVRATICVQASGSQASGAISQQAWFGANSFKDPRLVRPQPGQVANTPNRAMSRAGFGPRLEEKAQ